MLGILRMVSIVMGIVLVMGAIVLITAIPKVVKDKDFSISEKAITSVGGVVVSAYLIWMVVTIVPTMAEKMMETLF
jgi:hypothetical protein